MNRTLFFSLSLTSSSSDEESSCLVQKIFLNTLFLVLFPLYVFFLFESSSSFLFFFLVRIFFSKMTNTIRIKKINEILPLYLSFVPFFSFLTKLVTSSESSKMSLLLLSSFSFFFLFFFDFLVALNVSSFIPTFYYSVLIS
jgi:hypothetical protein